MSLALAPAQDLASLQVLETMKAQAEILIASGLLPAHLNKSEKVITIMLMARELGIPNMVALREIYMAAPGRPTCSARLMTALVYRDHGPNALHVMETTDERCTVRYKRAHSTEHGTLTWTMNQAREAGLANKENWKHYPAAMLRSRAISAVCQVIFPDSVLGMYTPEDLGADVDEDGNVIEGAVKHALVGDRGASRAGGADGANSGANAGPSGVLDSEGVRREVLAQQEPPAQPLALQEPTEDLEAPNCGWTDEEHQGFARWLNTMGRSVERLLNEVLRWDSLDAYVNYVNAISDTPITPEDLMIWIKQYRIKGTPVPCSRGTGDCERCGGLEMTVEWWHGQYHCVDGAACSRRKATMQQQLERAVATQQAVAASAE